MIRTNTSPFGLSLGSLDEIDVLDMLDTGMYFGGHWGDGTGDAEDLEYEMGAQDGMFESAEDRGPLLAEVEDR